MDLVIIVDSSSSLGEENFELVLGFVEAILDDASIDSGDVRVGLMTLSDLVLNSLLLAANNASAVLEFPPLYSML
jgi:hypothetical protein